MTKLTIKNDTTPTTPDSGSTSLYVDSTTKKLVSKDDAGVETAYGAGGGGAADSVNSATTEIDLVSATAPSADQVLTATSSTAATWQTPSTEATGLINGFGTTSIDSEAAAPTAGQILIANSATDMSWQAAPSSGATDIDGLSDAASDGSSYFFGTDSGLVDDGTTNQNIGIGADTLKANTSGFDNVAIGGTALAANIIGQKNFAVGAGALRYATGSYNTAIGFNASHRQTTPSTNTSIGTNAGMNNATGGSNTAIGFQALTGVNGNSSASNTALGYNAGAATTTGGSNTYIGTSTAATGTTGSRNILLGYAIDLPSAATDDYLNIGDVIIGDISTGEIDLAALATTAIPLTVSAIASQTANLFEVKDSAAAELVSITSAGRIQVLESTGSTTPTIQRSDATDHGLVMTGTTGNRVTSLVSDSFSYQFTKSGMINYAGQGVYKCNGFGTATATIFGHRADVNTGLYFGGVDDIRLSAGGLDTFIGTLTYSSVASVFGVGQYATGSLPTASSFTGYMAYDTTTSEVKFSDGSTWAAFGGGGGSGDVVGPAVSLDNEIARFDSTTGKLLQAYTSGGPTIGDTGEAVFNADLTINGKMVLDDGGGSVYVGLNAGLVDDATANNNIGIGSDSLKATTTGSGNIAIGAQALITNITGATNTAIGYQNSYYLTGSNNVSAGYQALTNCTSANSNVGIGVKTLKNNISGDNNTAIGYQALHGTASSILANNVVIGYNAGFYGTTASNNVYIGYQVGLNATTASDNIIIGYALEPTTGTTSNELNIGDIIKGDISTGAINLEALATTATPLTAKGIVSQTANIFSVQDSTAKEFLAVSSTGALELDGGGNYVGTSAISSNDTTLYLDSSKKNGFGTNGTGNNLALYNNDVRVLYWSTTSCTVGSLPFYSPNGSVSAPTFAFSGMHDGGMYRDSGTDTLRIAMNGVDSFTYDDNYTSSAKIFLPGQYATGSLPTASSYEGAIAYDTTTQTMKWSNGTAWATI